MIGRKNRFIRGTGVGLALVMTLALSAGPLLAQCQNQDGTPRDCTPSENATACLEDANDAHAQCLDQAASRWARGSCHIGRMFDGIGCAFDLASEIVGLDAFWE